MSSFWDTFTGKSAEPSQPTIVIQQPEAKPAEEKVDPTKDFQSWFKPAETDAKPTEFKMTEILADPAKVKEQIGKINFVADLANDQELLAKLEAGGPEAVKATMLALNRASQQTLTASMETTDAMIKAAMAQAKPMITQELQTTKRNDELNSAIRGANEVFTQPGMEAVVDNLRSMFLAKFPNATSEQVRDMALSYATDVMRVRPKEDPATSTAAPTTDWSQFL